jgi:hypothetical protein
VITLFALFLTLAVRPHPGPSIWADVRIEDDRVVLELQAELEPIEQCFGIEGPWLGPAAPELQARLERELLEAFRTGFPVTIDGTQVQPELEQLSLPVDDPDTDGWLVVKAHLVYPASAPPRRVTITWDRFGGTEFMGERYVPMLVKRGREVDMMACLEREPSFTWHARGPRAHPRAIVPEEPPPDRSPWAIGALSCAAASALGCFALRRRPLALRAGILVVGLGGALALGTHAGKDAWRFGSAAMPGPDQAERLFEALHAGIYAAFEADDEDTIYELLARSVDVSLLDELYADIYESLVLREEGGAVCRIDGMEVFERDVRLPKEREGDPRFEVDWGWTVDGLVAHWGHIHRRTNRYRATYGVRHDGRSWKIDEVKILEHDRTDDDG